MGSALQLDVARPHPSVVCVPCSDRDDSQLVRGRSRRRSRCRLCALQQVGIQPPRFSPWRRLEKSVSAPGTALSPAGLPPYSVLEEPPLIFDAADPGATDVHPLRGLAHHGPFSRASLLAYTPTIRVATVGPARTQRTVQRLVESLRGSHRPGDRPEYVPEYPGFTQLFGADIELADAPAHVRLPHELASGEEAIP